MEIQLPPKMRNLVHVTSDLEIWIENYREHDRDNYVTYKTKLVSAP